MPSAPQICTARSTTRPTASATKTLDTEENCAAALEPVSNSCRTPDQRTARLDVDLGIGEHLLHHAEVPQLRAEGLAAPRVLQCEVLGAARGPEPAHAAANVLSDVLRNARFFAA